MNRYRDMLGSREGVTLIELLVVMLIVVILTISLLPFFQGAIIRAQYTAEAIPVIGDLRLKTELHRYEPGGLPGVRPVEGLDNVTHASAPTAGVDTYTQTYAVDDDAATVVAQFFPAVLNGVESDLIDRESPWVHFSRNIEASASDFVGRRMKPTDVFYNGFQGGNGYVYALGAFGGGEESRLRPGSGYAVLEVVNRNVDVNMKIVAEWRRFVEGPLEDDATQVLMLSGVDGGFAPPADWDESGICYTGDPTLLLSNDEDLVRDELNVLTLAGWDLNVTVLEPGE